MTKQKYLKLPKVYELSRERPEEKYIKFLGVPKLSYSAINSFKEDGYRGEFFSNYFLNVRGEGNIFTAWGSACGTMFEHSEETELLSEFDKEVIRKIGRPEGAIYEKEIVIDRGNYVLQGFLDRTIIKENKANVIDLKSGSIAKKKAYYSSEEYSQTDTYCYALDEEGFEIEYSGVILLDRAGNGTEKHPMRLTGQVEYIDRDYSREKTEKILEEFDYVAKEIERYFAVYNKYLK